MANSATAAIAFPCAVCSGSLVFAAVACVLASVCAGSSLFLLGGLKVRLGAIPYANSTFRVPAFVRLCMSSFCVFQVPPFAPLSAFSLLCPIARRSKLLDVIVFAFAAEFRGVGCGYCGGLHCRCAVVSPVLSHDLQSHRSASFPHALISAVCVLLLPSLLQTAAPAFTVFCSAGALGCSCW